MLLRWPQTACLFSNLALPFGIFMQIDLSWIEPWRGILIFLRQGCFLSTYFSRMCSICHCPTMESITINYHFIFQSLSLHINLTSLTNIFPFVLTLLKLRCLLLSQSCTWWNLQTTFVIQYFVKVKCEWRN